MNPIAEVQVRFKGLEDKFKSWLSQQPLPIETAVVSFTSALQGAAIGALMGTLAPSADLLVPPIDASPQAMSSFKQAQAFAGGPLIQARNVAIMTGSAAAISCVLKRIRGKEDIESSMAAAFGSGALYSLVSGVGGPNPAANMITTGLTFALFQGGIFALGKKMSQPKEDDPFYTRTKSMLTILGLQGYEKNFKKGLLTDNTLPLLTDSALRDVKIPPGPRLLILNHVEREHAVKGGR